MLTGYDGRTFTYDTIGNLTNDGERTYTWKHGRQLATLSDGSTTWTYTYNADGMRTKRSNGATTYNYVYNGSQLTQMTVGSNTLYISYDASGRPFTLNYNGAVYYYVLNMLGDVVGIANSAGTLVVRYWYDAWGYAESCTGTMASTLGVLNPLRYRGYVYDQETELYYLQSRYYNPERGRFLNADAYISTGQGFTGNNMFAYCNNNPVNGHDPCGTCFHRWDFWNDCEKCGGKTIEDKWSGIITWCKDAYDTISSVQQQQTAIQNQIIMEQTDILKGTAEHLWNAYEHSIELETQTQHEKTIAIKHEIEKLTEDPIQGGDFIAMAGGNVLTYGSYVSVVMSPTPIGVVTLGFSLAFSLWSTLRYYDVIK